MNAIIHYNRVNRPLEVFNENEAIDDGYRLDTRTRLHPEFGRRWVEQSWAPEGLIQAGLVIAEVRKHIFYQEWFSIMELRSSAQELLGYYCDILTPLQKRDNVYHLKDLMLDLWVDPMDQWRVLDREEFDAAVFCGLIDPYEQVQAEKTLKQQIELTESHRLHQIAQARASLFGGEEGSFT